MSESFVYECALCVLLLIRTVGIMGGEMIVVVKCRGEEAENMLLRQTRRSTHNNCGTLVNVHDDAASLLPLQTLPKARPALFLIAHRMPLV